MRIGLCLFFNYPFERNFPTLRKIYGDHFDEVRFIQPLIPTSATDAFTVYRAAFNFSGFFSDARHFIEEMKCDVVVFAGDDCVVNRNLFGDNFAQVFGSPGEDFDAFITKFNPLSGEGWWRNTQKIRALGRLFGQNGIYDQRIMNWKNYFPDPDYVEEKLASYGVVNDRLCCPPEEDIARMPRDQQAVIRDFFHREKERALPYPLTYAVSDFFIVTSDHLQKFCHNSGLFAALNLFSEFSTPTALACIDGRVKQAPELGLKVDWTFGNNKNAEHFVPRSLQDVSEFVDGMGATMLYKHPVKLSSVNM